MSYSQKNSLGVEYHLNKKVVQLNNGATSIAYFFSKVPRPETACDLPEDKQVVESARSHILVLKNK